MVEGIFWMEHRDQIMASFEVDDGKSDKLVMDYLNYGRVIQSYCLCNGHKILHRIASS